MNNNNIIKFIENVCIENEKSTNISYDEMCDLLTYSEYYVRPGDNYDKFSESVEFAMQKGTICGALNFFDDPDAPDINSSIGAYIIKLILEVVREFFDREYFESQIANISEYDTNDEKLLSEQTKAPRLS